MSTVRALLRAWGFIKFVDSVVHIHNYFRLYLQHNVVRGHQEDLGGPGQIKNVRPLHK